MYAGIPPRAFQKLRSPRTFSPRDFGRAIPNHLVLLYSPPIRSSVAENSKTPNPVFLSLLLHSASHTIPGPPSPPSPSPCPFDVSIVAASTITEFAGLAQQCRGRGRQLRPLPEASKKSKARARARASSARVLPWPPQPRATTVARCPRCPRYFPGPAPVWSPQFCNLLLPLSLVAFRTTALGILNSRQFFASLW
jgi:hypothetical protein